MKKILAIGGAVVKTAVEELKTVVLSGDVEMLVHNGGSIFHDFQLSSPSQRKKLRGRHSYPLDELLDDTGALESVSRRVWLCIRENYMRLAPSGSVTNLCANVGIPVLMFTAPYADFWYGFQTGEALSHAFAEYEDHCWENLVSRFRGRPFHYVCMGSAVIHPEIFIKAVAAAKPKDFVADVVDMKEQYRPRTRVARFGRYHMCTHKTFLDIWRKHGYPSEGKTS